MRPIAPYFVLVWLIAFDLATRTLAVDLLEATRGFRLSLPGVAVDYMVRPSAGLAIWPTVAFVIIAVVVLVRLRSSHRVAENLAGSALLAGGAANLLELWFSGTITTLLSVGPASGPLFRLNLAHVWIVGAVLLALGDAIARAGTNLKPRETEV